MAAGTIVSLEEYLNTTYEPDCEYLDGELVERNVGEIKHSDLQGLIYAYFLRRGRAWGIRPLVEVRVRIRERRYLIPDVCVIRLPLPQERVLTTPPWIWIEILSPEDRPLRVQRKIEEVLAFGCEWVWVVDPETLDSRVYTKGATFDLPDGVFRIPGTEIVVPLHELDE
jgi:Uma2 family endonuclease